MSKKIIVKKSFGSKANKPQNFFFRKSSKFLKINIHFEKSISIGNSGLYRKESPEFQLIYAF